MGTPQLDSEGRVKGSPYHFSRPGYNGGYPFPRYGEESYKQYRERVQTDFVSKGFSISDLTNECYMYYCQGSGTFEGVDENAIIGDI